MKFKKNIRKRKDTGEIFGIRFYLVHDQK